MNKTRITISMLLAFAGVLALCGTATAQPPKTLTIIVQGAGSVTLDPAGGSYARGTPVTMTATPDPGWVFDRWEGPTIEGSTSNPQVITMYNNYTVTAFFTTPTGVDIVRKRDAVVRVVDSGQNPVAGVDVAINMESRDFPFGVAVSKSLLSNSQYRDFVRQNSPRWWDWAVFENEAKWYANEGAQGFVNYQDADAMIDLLSAWGFTLRGHALFWAVPDFIQQWVQDLPYPTELQQAVDARLNDAVSHFAGKFAHWDVNNEMVHGTFFEDRLGAGTRAAMHNQTAALDPGVLITVNDYNVVSGGWDLQAFKDLVVQLEADGAQIDNLGVQCHMNTDDTIEEINQRLNSVAELGYPIWVTEFDVADPDPTVRAQAVEDFYRTAFAHPSVEGILMWGFWAGDHWRGADAALVDLDWTLNEAGQRYASLMAEWWTDTNGTSDSAGEVSFNGFHGTYNVTLTNGGSPEVHNVTLSAGSGTEVLTVVLGNGTPADQAAPTPDPLTWSVEPTPLDENAVTMTAATASDASGVEYYFSNLTDPSHDSGWLDTPFFTDTGLSTGVQYTYAVKTRDKAVVPNEGSWSAQRSAATSADDNVLVNSGFEYGYPDGWSDFGSSSILATDEQSASGQFSCYVGNRSETWKGITQDLMGKMTDGGTYDMSASFLLANSASEPVQMTIKQVDAAGTNYFGVGTGTANDTSWTQVSGTFTLNVTGSLTELRVFLEGPAIGVDMYVDDITAIATATPPPPPAACDNDGVCEAGEDCNNCASDCAGVTGGKPANRYCCGNGVAESAEGGGAVCDGNF